MFVGLWREISKNGDTNDNYFTEILGKSSDIIMCKELRNFHGT